MSDVNAFSRRRFLGGSMAALAATGVALEGVAEDPNGDPKPPAEKADTPSEDAKTKGMPYATIGNVKISRLMLGGNLVAGFMHNRDLMYVPQLFRAYMTEEKIFETFKISEENGINTLFESGWQFVERYNKEYGGHLQILPSVRPTLGQDDATVKRLIQSLVDTGAPAIYLWGVAADKFTRAGQIGMIAKTVEFAKKHGIPVGVGAHSLQVIVECEKAKVPCDFYVKTLHTDNYASAMPKELRKDFVWLDGGKGFYDNMWCLSAEETVAFMKTVQKPWIAFKVLAAGAIPPRDGFSYAFHNGADLIAVGMFDFQVKQNCTMLKRVVKNTKQRERPWYA
jgi:hypothetical protein